MKKLPEKAWAKIAVDSKYWLWINGKMVIFEGGLKRGPDPRNTYYDTVDLSAYLTKGNNTIAVLAWYFGKQGFSHVDSGKFGFLFECITPGITLATDASWKVIRNEAYQTCPPPLPNFRLPESSIRFDAAKDPGLWYTHNFSAQAWKNATELGRPPMAPWNRLVQRPIPQWKNSGLVSYLKAPAFPVQYDKDTVITCTLPSNLQVTPYLKIETREEGKLIEIITENLMGGGEPNVYAQYVAGKGIQEYESYGWMNGHTVTYKIPAGVKVLDLKYRETGYDTEFAGSFTSSDDFLNRIWQKARRTLYLTMRDNYMDCPDRERAQWWGDEVNEGGEAFYALDTKSHLLFKKGMYELINWQKPDSTLFSPIPAGNWNKELPVQMLTSIGYYGFWNYYLNTGDLKTISDLYPGVKKYLQIWKLKENGTVEVRKGGWSWGDWGDNIDMDLLTNGFYYLALQGAANMADALSLKEEAFEYRQMMAKMKATFNKEFWDGSAYRYPGYKGKTDDRSQAVAIVSGIADPDQYPALRETLKKEEHASPYMEKYVLEALFKMGYADDAVERMKKRFADMVNDLNYATLFEVWRAGNVESWLRGTTNHAWSGGALTLLSQYMCGVEPAEPGYASFRVFPNPGSVKNASAGMQSVKGMIKSRFTNSEHLFTLEVTVPKATTAVIGIPVEKVSAVRLNHRPVWKDGLAVRSRKALKYQGVEKGRILFRVAEGTYSFEAVKYKK
ncbi:alpha-L-rhamnosidase-related protein [Chryseobacterium hagamense]|nr:alpha-L-rhamnosidase C-terminal domain-containing protein [Chryseobacterium hagamense]